MPWYSKIAFNLRRNCWLYEKLYLYLTFICADFRSSYSGEFREFVFWDDCSNYGNHNIKWHHRSNASRSISKVKQKDSVNVSLFVIILFSTVIIAGQFIKNLSFISFHQILGIYKFPWTSLVLTFIFYVVTVHHPDHDVYYSAFFSCIGFVF